MVQQAVSSHSALVTGGSSSSVRWSWVDTAKGFGIFLVVLGHVLRGLITSGIMPSTPTTQFLDGWIYTFHMPLFIVLSGLFLVRSLSKPWGQFLSDKIRVLAYPYLVWSVITLLVKDVFAEFVNHPYDITDLPLVLYHPIDQYWFLYVLFVLLVAFSLLLRLRLPPVAILGLAVLVYPGVLPLPSPGILGPIRMMSLYVALGLFLGAKDYLSSFQNIRPAALVVIVVAGFAFSMLGGLPALPHAQAFKPALALSAIAASMSLALLVNKFGIDAAVQFIGRHSLEIYLLHTIASAAARILLVQFFHITAPGLHIVLGLIAGMSVPILAVLLCEKLNFQYAFMFPKRPRSQQAQQRNESSEQGMRKRVVAGWIISLAGTALWIWACFIEGAPPLINWGAIAPNWIAEFLPNIQSEIGMLLSVAGMIPMYWPSSN